MKTLLLIEDNDDIREMTADILTLAQYRVLTAANGKLGVELALQHHPDLVICDIMMPVLDGYGVLQIFNQNEALQGTPFLFLTAKTERADFRKGMEMGADDYLTKPFEEVELLRAIESRLARVEKWQKRNTLESLDQLYGAAQAAGGTLQALPADRRVSRVPRKQLIYAEGDEPTRLYFLKAGKVKTHHSNRDGKEFITGIHQAGDFFGYLALISGTDYPESATALEDCELVPIPKQDFLALLYGNPQVTQEFVRMLANQVSDREKNLLGMAYNSLRKRTAEALVHLSRQLRGQGNDPAAIRVSRDDLASVVGTATESLIRTLSDFKAEGLVSITGSAITILKEEKLATLRN